MNIPLIRTRTAHRLGAGLLLALGLAACTEKASTPPKLTPPVTPVTPVLNEDARAYADYNTLVWSDEFNGNVLDGTAWSYNLGGGGWGNNELQNYTNSGDNVYLTGGNLVIKAIKQPSGSNAYSSGRIITNNKKTFQYGRLDVRAKVPKGKGIWPAIWMMGSNFDQVGWPMCGEIDIMELRGSQPMQFLSTMHFGNSVADRRNKGFTKVLTDDITNDFHVFTVVRSRDLLRFFYDGQQYYQFTSADSNPFPFNNPFFLILNVAVGGDFDGDPNASTVFPQQMQVDYVRHYQYK